MTFKYENQKISAGYKYIIGCDEVGRGCLAGPVVAAAVALPRVESEKLKVIKFREIKDSKLLTAQKREELAKIIKEHFLWSIAEVSSEEIDEINIHNASLLAMKRAISGVIPEILSASEKLSGIQSKLSSGSRPSDALGRDGTLFLAVDGKFKVPYVTMAQEAIIGGDNKVLSIAAASIIAKVYRDELMQKLHNEYPIYNLKQHKGYATEHHRKIILERGLSPIHRLSFCQNLAI